MPHRISTALFLTLLIAPGAGVMGMGAAQSPPITVCDRLAARFRASTEVSAGAVTMWAFATSGPAPLIELARVKELSLERAPEADERVQFEKRLRARFGNAELLLKALRDWDDFDVLTRPGTDVHMVLTATGAALCEARLFFRTTTSREAFLLPEPPSGGDNHAICERLGGWGYLASVMGVEAFVEYHLVDRRESFRVVPLTNDGWGTPCAVPAP